MADIAYDFLPSASPEGMKNLMLGDEDRPQSGDSKSQLPIRNSSPHAALERLSVIIVK